MAVKTKKTAAKKAAKKPAAKKAAAKKKPAMKRAAGSMSSRVIITRADNRGARVLTSH